MPILVNISTAQTIGVQGYASSDGKTELTGATLAVVWAKQGETGYTSIAPTVTDVDNGLYAIDLTTTHNNTSGMAHLRATAASMDPINVPNAVDVVAFEKTSATRGCAGTALPAVAAQASGGLMTMGTGAGQINQPANGMIDVNAVRLLGTAYATPTVAGVQEVDVTHFAGTVAATPTVAGIPKAEGSGGTIAAVSGAVGSVTGAVGSVTGAVGSVAAGGIARAAFAQDALDLFGERRRDTAQTGGASTITLDASASAVDDFYKNGIIVLVSGTGVGQFRTISSYVGATKVATVDRAWSTTPDATSIFELFAAGGSVDAATVAGAVWNAARASYVAAGSFGESDASVLEALGIIRRNTAQSGASTTITLDAAASAVNDFYKNGLILIVGGVGTLQFRTISSYVGATKVATVDRAWGVNPDATSVFLIVMAGGGGSGSGGATAVEVDTQLTATHGAGSWRNDRSV